MHATLYCHILSLIENHIILSLYHPHLRSTRDKLTYVLQQTQSVQGRHVWVIFWFEMWESKIRQCSAFAGPEWLEERHEIPKKKKLSCIPPPGYFCSSFVVYEALHRDVSLHTLFTTVCVCACAPIPECGSKIASVNQHSWLRRSLQLKQGRSPSSTSWMVVPPGTEHLCSTLQSTGLSGLPNT